MGTLPGRDDRGKLLCVLLVVSLGGGLLAVPLPLPSSGGLLGGSPAIFVCALPISRTDQCKSEQQKDSRIGT